MSPDTISAITTVLSRFPQCRSEPVVDEAEISSVEHRLGVVFSEDYKQFVRLFGGAVVRANMVYGLRLAPYMKNNKVFTVEGATAFYRKNKWPGTESWYVISADYSGNPIGIDASGTVWIYDHNQMTAEKLFNGFEEWLLGDCLKPDEDEDEEDDERE